MISKKIEDIDATEIENLIANSVSESTTLEFKRALPGTTDVDKKEFLADISALANTSGGDLIFGVEEKDGCANKLKLLDSAVIDNEMLRLDSLINSGIEPRIRYQSGVVDFPDGKVLIFRAEKSWSAPHRVVLKGHDKFYARTSAGKYSLDVQQLRDAFLVNASIADKLRDFRTSRMIEIIAGRTPVDMGPGSKLVLHLLPFEAFAKNSTYDLGGRYSRTTLTKPMQSSGWDERITLEGKLAFSQYGTSPVTSYSHFYRNGLIEAVEGTILNHTHQSGAKNLPSIAYERILIDALQNYLAFFKSIGVQGPIAIAMSLTGVKGAIIGVNTFWHSDDVRPVIQDHLLLPETVLPTLDDAYLPIVRPSFDLVWNACGMSHSSNFTQDGEWSPRN